MLLRNSLTKHTAKN